MVRQLCAIHRVLCWPRGYARKTWRRFAVCFPYMQCSVSTRYGCRTNITNHTSLSAGAMIVALIQKRDRFPKKMSASRKRQKMPAPASHVSKLPLGGDWLCLLHYAVWLCPFQHRTSRHLRVPPFILAGPGHFCVHDTRHLFLTPFNCAALEKSEDLVALTIRVIVIVKRSTG